VQHAESPVGPHHHDQVSGLSLPCTEVLNKVTYCSSVILPGGAYDREHAEAALYLWCGRDGETHAVCIEEAVVALLVMARWTRRDAGRVRQ
jgi:hypothetical protein